MNWANPQLSENSGDGSEPDDKPVRLEYSRPHLRRHGDLRSTVLGTSLGSLDSGAEDGPQPG